MWVVSKRTLLFQKERFVDDPVTKEKRVVVDETFTLVPNAGDHALDPVEAPDWIKQTELYKLLRKEKSIWESADAGKSEEDEETDKDKQAAEKTGLPQSHKAESEQQSSWKKK